MDDLKRQQLSVMIRDIAPPDEASREECYKRWDAIAKPIRGLGRLEDLTAQIAAIERTPEIRLERRALAVFCSDNGIVEEGVAQTKKDVTAVVTANFTRGITSANAMAAVADVDVFPIDIGVDGKISEPGLIDMKISCGTGDFLKGPAMSLDDALSSVLAGIEVAGRLKDMGYTIAAAGEMGIGNTTTSAAVAAVMLGLTPGEAAGRGAGLSDEGLKRKAEVIDEGIRLHHPDPERPLEVLSTLGGYDIGGICGLMIGGAIYGMPVVMDGVVSCAAALLAAGMEPKVKEYLLPSHLGKEPVCCRAMDALGLKPVIHADLALGEGSGALLLFPLLDMVMAVYRQNTTFEKIEIAPYERF